MFKIFGVKKSLLLFLSSFISLGFIHIVFRSVCQVTCSQIVPCFTIIQGQMINYFCYNLCGGGCDIVSKASTLSKVWFSQYNSGLKNRTVTSSESSHTLSRQFAATFTYLSHNLF